MKLKTGLISTLLFLATLVSAQIPTWKHQFNWGTPKFLHVDQFDNTYIITDLLPDRFLKLSPGGTQVYNKAMTPNGYELRILAAVLDTNTSTMLVGGIVNWQNKNRFAIAKLDLVSGDFLNFAIDTVFWASPFYLLGNPQLTLSVDEQGNIYLMGAGDYEYNFFLKTLSLKFNAQFEEVASYLDPVYQPDIPLTGVVAKDGSVFYNGGFYDPSSVNKHYIEKAVLGQADTVQWRHYIPDWQYVMSMKLLPDGDLLLLINERQSNNIYRSLVSRVHDLGTSAETVWTTEAPMMDAEFYDLYYDAPQNKVYAAGSYFLGEALDLNKLYTGFVCLNASTGAIQWSYENTAGGRYTLGHVETDTTGRLWAVGSSNFNNYDTDYWVGYFTPDAQLVDAINYHGNCPNENESAFDFAFRKDQKIIVTGSACESLSSSNYTTTLLYDSIPPLVSTQTPLEKPAISVAPNPVSDILSLTTDLEGAYDYQLMDIYGKCCLKGQITDSETSISVAAVPSGLYLLYVQKKGMPDQVLKVVVQR